MDTAQKSQENIITLYEHDYSAYSSNSITEEAKLVCDSDIATVNSRVLTDPLFAPLGDEQKMNVQTFISLGIRLGLLSFAHTVVEIDAELSFITVVAKASGILLHQDVLECLCRLNALTDHIILDDIPAGKNPLARTGFSLILPLKEDGKFSYAKSHFSAEAADT